MQELSLDIERTREYLHDLLNKGLNILDPRVLDLSEKLDKLLTKYYSLESYEQ